MASLLSKFRIDYSALKVIPDISKPAQDTTKNFFNTLIVNFQETENAKPDDGIYNYTRISVIRNFEKFIKIDLFSGIIKDSELIAMKEKTNRHLRLRELLLENSMDANLVVM